MMPPQPHRHARICPNCDGFARVAIATGSRMPDGSRHTIPVDCLTCHGHGVIARPLAITKAL